ncbi:MAG: hypothetical protein ABI462_03480 [Ignavibacteria bacterium]
MKIFPFTILILFFVIIIFKPDVSYSQPEDSVSIKKDTLKQKPKVTVKKKAPPKKIKEESFMDKFQKLFEIRRSFDVSDQITKPAILSLKKDNDEKTVFSIDMAVAYKGFQYEVAGVTPSIQFDYSTKSKDQIEKVRAGLETYYRIYEYSGGSGKISPAAFFWKDFYSKLEEMDLSLTFNPRFPKFFLPVRNISDVKFKYDGEDNRWVFGINPVVGATYERLYGGKKNISQTEYYTITAANFTIKRYYLQFDVYGNYEKEFIKSHNIRYKWETTMTFYFDIRERSSINFKFEQAEKDLKKRTRRLTIGFGIKL